MAGPGAGQDLHPSDAKIIYALTRLEGAAREHARTSSAHDFENPYETIEDLYARMKTDFADPNKES
jgi:hypothetical protein